MATPKKNTAYSAMVALSSPSTPGKFAINPTITVGDFKVSIDGLGGYKIRRGGSSEPAIREGLDGVAIKREDKEIMAIIMAAVEIIE